MSSDAFQYHHIQTLMSHSTASRGAARECVQAASAAVSSAKASGISIPSGANVDPVPAPPVPGLPPITPTGRLAPVHIICLTRGEFLLWNWHYVSCQHLSTGTTLRVTSLTSQQEVVEVSKGLGRRYFSTPPSSRVSPNKVIQFKSRQEGRCEVHGMHIQKVHHVCAVAPTSGPGASPPPAAGKSPPPPFVGGTHPAPGSSRGTLPPPSGGLFSPPPASVAG